MNIGEYLEELKNHDWTYSYASGPAYKKGLENDQRLRGIAADDSELEALRTAYCRFVWGEGDEPSLESAPTKKPDTPKFNLSQIMNDAWHIAKKASKRFGGRAKSYVKMSLKQAWAKAKARAIGHFRGRSSSGGVYFICIDERLSYNTRIIDQPLIDRVFTDEREAKAALQVLSGAFDRPFIKTSPYFHM